MANLVKGEVSFEVKGKTYTMVFSNNAFCSLETELDRGILDIYAEIAAWAPPRDAKGKLKPETAQQTMARVKNIRLGFCRALFWAGLLDHHPEITLRDAGELMTDAGGLIAVMGLIEQGIAASQPTEKELGEARPPKGAARRRGVGQAS